MIFYVKQLLTYKKKNHADSMNDKEQFYYYIPASLGQVQPIKLAIRLFYLYSGGGLQWFVVVCGGLPAFHRFHRLSSQILVTSGLRWFVMVCGGLSYSRTRLFTCITNYCEARETIHNGENLQKGVLKLCL